MENVPRYRENIFHKTSLARCCFQLWHGEQVDEGREQDAAGLDQPRDQQAAGPAAHPRLRQAATVPAAADGTHTRLRQEDELLRETWDTVPIFYWTSNIVLATQLSRQLDQLDRS